MDNLPLDVLVQIVETLKPADHKKLLLVCKSLQAAVEGAKVSLWPRDKPSGPSWAQLGQLCAKFPRATSLRLGIAPGTKLNDSKVAKQRRMRKDKGLIAVLPATLLSMPMLEYIRMDNQIFLTQLPPAIGSLTSLRELNLYGCQSLTALPEEIGRLALLRSV